MPRLCRQSGATSTVRPGLQPGQLSASAGAAPGYPALVADDAERKTNQDRSEGHPARRLPDISDGRGRHPSQHLPVDPPPNRQVPTPCTACGPHMTKFLLGKPADQGSRVPKLGAASDVRPRKGGVSRRKQASGTVCSAKRLLSGRTCLKMESCWLGGADGQAQPKPIWEIPAKLVFT